ncbi:MAG: MinD/ParA family protein [Actinomycetales bacterium]|nr:MinD/ParA family protein [Actinomycetales bacterium]
MTDHVTRRDPADAGAEPSSSSDSALAVATDPALTFRVELPPVVHETPDDEVAVALPDVPVDAAGAPAALATSSLELDPIAYAEEAPPEPEPEIPPLPGHDDPAPERRRRRALASPPPPVPRAVRRFGRAAYRAEAPEGRLPFLVWRASLRLVHLDDSFAVRERKALDRRIGATLYPPANHVAVVTRKGGVGQTTVAALLGLAMARVRDDLVVALDANPDRGTLGDRFGTAEDATIADVVAQARRLGRRADFAAFAGAEPGRLVVVGSDRDPARTAPLDPRDFGAVSRVLDEVAGIVITDTGTGLRQEVTRAALRRADGLVLVAGAAVDEAQLASETLDGLEANGDAELVRGAVVVLNTATVATDPARLDDIEAHFAARTRAVVRMPYDPALAAGAPVRPEQLQPLTRDIVRELAALVVDGLSAPEEAADEIEAPAPDGTGIAS